MLFDEEILTGRPRWYVFVKAWHIPKVLIINYIVFDTYSKNNPLPMPDTDVLRPSVFFPPLKI